VIDVANARYMAERISGAKLIELAGVDHSYLVGDRDARLDESRGLFDRRAPCVRAGTRARYGAVCRYHGLN
jgi:hypothetical protein